MKNLTVDPDRTHLPETGIYVRALNPEERWVSADIAHLNRDGLDEWLRSRDSIEWPINVVKAILGHPQAESGHSGGDDS